MCKKCKPSGARRIDKCMKDLCFWIDVHGEKKKGRPNYLKVVGSCCGHGKYPMTIVVRNHLGHIWELISNTGIHRKRRFYKRDKDGIYFIPEVCEEKSNA